MLARGLTYPRRIATRRVGVLGCEAAAVTRPDSTRRARRIKRLLPSALWARSSVDLARDRMPHTNDPERGQQYQQGACGAGDHFSRNTAEQTRCLQPELRPAPVFRNAHPDSRDLLRTPQRNVSVCSMKRVWGPTVAAAVITVVLATPAQAAAPNYILVSGRGLSHPVLLADWQENMKLLLAVANSPRAQGQVLAGLSTRPRFD